MKLARQSPQEILKARAAEMARPARVAEQGEELAVVEFGLSRERYAVEQAYATGIHTLHALAPLPGAPSFLRGIINVRGRILPVIDIKHFFDLASGGIADIHFVIIVTAGDMEVGIIADVVIGVRSVPVRSMQSSLPTLAGIRAEYLKGITPEALVVLDVPRLLADPRLIVNDQVEPATP